MEASPVALAVKNPPANAGDIKRGGLLFPPPGDLPDPGIKPTSLYVSCIGT